MFRVFVDPNALDGLRADSRQRIKNELKNTKNLVNNSQSNSTSTASNNNNNNNNESPYYMYLLVLCTCFNFCCNSALCSWHSFFFAFSLLILLLHFPSYFSGSFLASFEFTSQETRFLYSSYQFLSSCCVLFFICNIFTSLCVCVFFSFWLLPFCTSPLLAIVFSDHVFCTQRICICDMCDLFVFCICLPKYGC